MILGIGWIRLMPIVRQAFDRLAMAQERISALLTDHLLGDGLRSQTDGRQATEVMVWTTAATGIEYLRVVAAVTPHAGSYREGDCYRRS